MFYKDEIAAQSNPQFFAHLLQVISSFYAKYWTTCLT